MRSFMRVPYRRPLVGIAAVGIALTAAVMAPSLASAAPSAPAVATCTASSLEVWIGVGRGGAVAGGLYLPLEFTNISSTACTLDGAPAVYAVGSTGKQLGNAAVQSAPAGTVTLAAGATASSSLKFVDTSIFPATSCAPVAASGLYVAPPGTGTYVNVPYYEFKGCSKTGDNYLISGSVFSGVGVP